MWILCEVDPICMLLSQLRSQFLSPFEDVRRYRDGDRENTRLCGPGRTLDRENTWFCRPGRRWKQENTRFRGSGPP